MKHPTRWAQQPIYRRELRSLAALREAMRDEALAQKVRERLADGIAPVEVALEDLIPEPPPSNA
jgi:hypothetical protein